MIGIYMITNKINGLSYIGRSKCIEKRYQRHKYLANTGFNGLLHEDIRKYGFDNFELTVLQETDNIEDTIKLEEYYIQLHNTITPNGYNKSKGPGAKGIELKGKLHYKNKEEWIKHCSESHIGKPSNRLGYKMTDEEKQYLRDYFTGRPNPKNAGAGNGMYGKSAPNRGKKIYVGEDGKRHYK